MKYQAAGVAVGLTLAGALTLRAQSGPSSIGREVSVPVHLRDGQEYSMPIAALLAHGQRLFNAVWTDQAGGRSCVAWSQLLSRTWKAQGIEGSEVHMLVPDTAVNLGANAFMVKEWRFGRHARTGADGIRNTDLFPDRVAGQSEVSR